MPVELFVDGAEPANPQAVVCRFLTFSKFVDLVQSSELYFNRADLFPQDDEEGLPPRGYHHVPGLHPRDIRDQRELNHQIGSVAEDREGFYVSCWYLFDEEHASVWRKYAEDGVAVFSRYHLLKEALASLPDRAFLGLVRYGSAHLTGWNIIRFITTKREQFAGDREVRAFLWIPDYHAGTRHFDEQNRPHDRPLTPPPSRVSKGERRTVDLRHLLTEVVVSPFASDDRLEEVRQLLTSRNLPIPVRSSDLTQYRQLLPWQDALRHHPPAPRPHPHPLQRSGVDL
jgi:hypothetical protein